jgi:dolichol-phosphate mannosyltransferase
MENPLPMLSVVCPAYLEEEVLPLFHRELCSVLHQLTDRWRVEVIYVEDGSPDRTLQTIQELADQDARVRYVSLSRNFGHQISLRAGLEAARGDVVISMDTDLQHPPTLIPQLLDKWREGFDVVQTLRAEDQRLGLFKRLTSRWFYRSLNAMSSLELREGASDFRLLSRRALNALLGLPERHCFLRGMVQWLGLPTAEVPFQPFLRPAGHTKYTMRRLLRLAGDGLFSFSSAPLRLPLYLGLVTLCLGLVFSLVFLIQAIFWPDQLAGSAGLMLLALFLGGTLLFSQGLQGEYLGRIHEQVKNRPLYLVKETAETRRALAEKERSAA